MSRESSQRTYLRRVELTGKRISLANLTGSLNGGRLGGSGYVVLGEGGIADVALEFTTDDVAFDAPLDLRSLSDANIRLAKAVTRSCSADR